MEHFWNSSVLKPQARISSEVRLLGWNVPPSDLRAIPEHWLSYPEPPTSMHYLLGMVYLAFFFASIVGNGVVIWIFASAKSLRTPSNVFVLNLAICDFFMMMKAPIFIYNSFKKGFALGPLGCQVFSFIGAYTGIGAAASNALIANDRYNVITKPLEGKLSHPKAVLLVFLVWAYATPWAWLPTLEIWGRFVPVCFFGRTSDVKFLGWNVPAEDLHHIPEFWLTQVEPPMYMHYLLALVYIGFTFAAIIGNGLVIWIFIGFAYSISIDWAKSLRTPSNLFVINLAFCDFIMMCKTPIFIYNSFMGGYALGHVGCQVFGFVGSCAGIAAGMTNAVIGYDRYNVIARPMEGKLSFTKAFLILFLIWFYTLPWAVLPLFEVWGRYVPEGYLTSCTFDYLTDNFDTRLFVGSIFTCSYLVPMSLIVYYYSQIVSQVFQHEKALREQAKKMNVDSLRSNQDTNKSSAEVRIAKAAITICFLFVASWTPYGVMALIGAFGDKNLLTPGVTMIPACTCKLVACIDPYVYAISHPKYRMELQKKLPWLAITEKESDAASTNTTAESQTTAA